MSFVYPGFLWGLLAISIPIVIHLFNFRSYKTVYFSNLAFLSNVQRERKSRSRLKHLLVLLMRIIAIAALVLAFAQPYIPLANQPASRGSKQHHVSVYIDNSFSMNAENDQGNLLEQAKSNAAEIAEGYPANTRFYLITNNFNPAHQHWAGKEQFLQMLNKIKPSPVTRTISSISQRQTDHIQNTMLNRDMQHTAYWISDFQKATTDIPQVRIDSISSVQLMQMQSQKVRNIYIDTAWYDTPSRKLYQDETLHVQIKNAGDEAYKDMPLKLYIDDTLRAISSFSIEANAGKVVDMNYTNQYNGDLLARLEITDYPITYDNELFFNYHLSKELQIAFVSDSANTYIERLFDDKLMNLQKVKPGLLKPNELNAYDAIILNEYTDIGSGLQLQLVNYVERGGSLIIIPPMTNRADALNNFIDQIPGAPLYEPMQEQKAQVKSINFNHKLYEQAFKKQEDNLNLPQLQLYYTFQLSVRSGAQTLLAIQNNNPVLMHMPYKQGEVYLFGFNLTRSTGNFVAHPLMVPTLYNMSLYSTRQNKPYHIIGGNTQVKIKGNIDNTSSVYHIKSVHGNADFIPRQLANTQKATVNLTFNNQIPKAGFYAVTTGRDTLRYLSFNYNRKESELTYYDEQTIREELSKQNLNRIGFMQADPGDVTSQIQKMSTGDQYWRLFLLIALLALAMEVFFIRFLR